MRSAAAVAALGVLATVLVAVVAGDEGTSLTDLGGLSAFVALLTGATGAGLGRLLRRRSLAVQVTLVVLTAVVAVALGAWVAARTMIVDRAVLSSLAVILAAAATGAGTTATIVVLRLRRESRSLVELTRRVADDELDDPAAPLPATEELRTIGQALTAAGDELRTARDRQRSLEAARRELVAWMSHDLRTPLASVRAMVSALEDRVVVDDETIARYHRTIRQEVDHLAQLIDDLFELNRAHARPTSAPVDVLPLGDLASDTLASMRALADAAGVTLSGQALQHPIVAVAAQDVGRALRNVIDNAIRQTPAGGTVTVTTLVRDRLGTVEVRDGCGGIPDDILPRVFDVGFTGQDARTRERRDDGRPTATGGGLGLAVARGLIELHGGRIEVANVADGCCFSLQLPLATPAVPVAGVAP